jgi:hypothetical protein
LANGNEQVRPCDGWVAEATSHDEPASRAILCENYNDPKRSLGWSGFVALPCLLLALSIGARAAEPTGRDSDAPWLRPYDGPTRTEIDATTLDGKVLCGYQGWFNTPGDGTEFGFTHWGQGLDRTNRGRFTVDMWPDVSEYAPEDLCEDPGLKMPDGSPARLYSAFRKGPVLLHFQWMRQYGIDGVFLSRFIGEAASPSRSRHVNQVLANVREGCHREGRVWAMMLDLSTGRNTTTATVMNDWRFLCDQVKVREDSRYLHQQKKPVVLLWGLGFKELVHALTALAADPVERAPATPTRDMVLWYRQPVATAADFHVAPNGRDEDPGTKEKPFATPTRAMDAVRALVAGGLKNHVRVVLRGNLIHDVHPSAYAHGGAPNNGFLIGEGSKGFLFESNVVHRTLGL